MSNINLQRFCACEHDPREYLRAPWPHKGYVYATNGHIIVRVPAPEHKQTVFGQTVADAAVNLFERATNTEYGPLPKFSKPKPCFECEGAGRVKQSKCGDCDGEGDFEHGSHTYMCQECDGDGMVRNDEGDWHDCSECHGTGHECKFTLVDEDIGYDARYLAWIAHLPHPMFAVGEPSTNEKPLAAHFIFTGGEGLLMPMRKD